MNIKEYQTQSGKKRFKLAGVYIGTDVLTGKPVKTTISGRTRKDVKIKLERLKKEFEENGSVKNKLNLSTFRELAESWFNQYKVGVKPRSVEIMRARLKTYVIPAIGDYKVDSITPALLQSIVNQWAVNASQPLKGASHRAVGYGKDFKLYFNIINRIYKDSIPLGIVDSNPCLKVRVPKIRLESTKREVQFFTNEQLGTFFRYLDTLPMEKYTNQLMIALCRLLVSSGLRVGESVALSWSDIDFDNKTVSVSKTTLRAVIQDTPKTSSSRRVVIIDNKAIDTLKRWRNFQARYFFKLGNPHQPLVFPTRTGASLDYQTLRPFLTRFFKACSLPNIGFHGFRHSHASLCLNAGIGYKELQHRLGHSSIKMTMDTYSHLEKEKQQQAVEIFEKFASF